MTMIANSKWSDSGDGFLTTIQTNNATETMIPERLKVSGMFLAKADSNDAAKITLDGIITNDRLGSVGLGRFIFDEPVDTFEELLGTKMYVFT